MWWKVYFWVNAIFLILAALGYFSYTSLKIADLIEVSALTLIMIGLYSYVFKKPVFSTNFWQKFLWLSVALTLFDLLNFSLNLESNPLINQLLISQTMEGDFISPGTYLFSLIISIPAIYAIYKLGYPTNSSKAKK
jgi:hypothetical protein